MASTVNHQIRVSEEVYLELLNLQRPRETFSELIRRLLLMTELLYKIEPLIRGQVNYLEQKRRDLETAHPVD